MKQKSHLRPTVQLLYKISGSRKLFYVLFGIFLLAALWIALSGAYSMAFDEYVHYGIIKLYTAQWSPYFSNQPAAADAFGAIVRDPSYLYHYLMSYPLRLFMVFSDSFTPQIIFLRICDISFVAAGLLVFRKAFLKAGLSQRTVNLALGFLLLMPVLPFMAAQVNYDTLLFLLSALTLYGVVKILISVEHENCIHPLDALRLTSVIVLACLVKYAFAPILLAVTTFLVIYSYRTFGLGRKQASAVYKALVAIAKTWQGVVAVLVVLVSLGLFIERYGVNTIRYHTPTPECNQVLALERCRAYEPFARNYDFNQGNYPLPIEKIAAYPFQYWIHDMVRSMFFVVSNKESGYQAGNPLLLAYAAGYIVLVGGAVLIATQLRYLWRHSVFNRACISIIATYTGFLFLQNFADFLHLAVAVAIQGRYAVPVLPLFLVLVAQAAQKTFKRFPAKVWLSTVVLLALMMFEGGSVLPFIIRSQDGWLWNISAVRSANRSARTVLNHVIVH